MTARAPPSTSLCQLFYAFRLADYVSYPHPELLVHNDRLTTCHEFLVYQNLEGLPGQLAQFDNRALAELEQIVDQNLRAPKFNRDFKRDIQQEIQVLYALLPWPFSSFGN